MVGRQPTPKEVGIGAPHNLDAFDRLRVSEPETIFDSKQLFDNAPLLWDDQETSGTGTTSVHSVDTASSVMSVGTGAGKRVRQTFMRFNYQPGKALRHGEPILTPTGWVAIEDVREGDAVFDGLGDTTSVVGVYPQGEREIVRVTFDDGTHVDCDLDHLWKTTIRQNSKKGQARVLSTRQMLDEYGEEPPAFARWRVPAAPVLKLPHQSTPIDPYTLGAILGDGHIDKIGFASFTTADPEILDHLMCDEATKRVSKYAYGLRGLSEPIRSLGLAGKGSHTKFIPDAYKYNDPETRLAVLQGLMDTDGTVDRRTGNAEYTSVSRQLAEDAAYLIRSLGGQAKIRGRETAYYDDNSERHAFWSYRVTVVIPVCPFRLERKAALWAPRTRISFDRYIHSIHPLGKSEATCIRVASDDHTFLTRNHVVTHNSQLIYMTGTLSLTGGGTGVICAFGAFDDENGIFWTSDEGTVKVVVRSKTTGSVVDNAVDQADWDDPMDGTGASGINLDFTKSQLLVIDYEWLSVGTVRVGVFIMDEIHYFHRFNHANVTEGAYMSTPNLPLRYSIESLGTGVASSMRAICSTVISEGGFNALGVLHHASTAGAGVTTDNEDELFAVIGIQLKSTHLDARVTIIAAAIQIQTASEFGQWVLIFNPTVAGAFTYSARANSAVNVALGGGAANSVTGGEHITGGFIETGGGNSGGASDGGFPGNALRLGSAIDGTQDTIVLCYRPINGTSVATVEGDMTWREAA